MWPRTEPCSVLCLHSSHQPILVHVSTPQMPTVSPSTHTQVWVRECEGQGSETIFLEVKQEYKIKVPAVHPFTRGSLSSLSA